MHLPKFIFKWWQAAIYETCVISFGIIVGAYWANFWSQWINILFIIFVITGVYLVWAFFTGRLS